MRIQWLIIATLMSVLMWDGLYEAASALLLKTGHHEVTIAHIERRIERHFL
jgi:hypothetical protein